MPRRFMMAFAALAAMLAVVASAARAEQGTADPRLTAAHWIARCADADRVLMDAAAVAAANRRLVEVDPSVRDLAALPATLSRDDVAARVAARSTLPAGPLFLDDGAEAGDEARRRWRAAAAADAIPAAVEPRFALVVRRAALRRFPTRERVHAKRGDADIDAFQESALFPGTPVAAVHASADGGWTFVIAATYDAWIETDNLAFGGRDAVLDYARRASRVVTGSRATTAFTPTLPALSELVLDMGTALPEIRNWPADEGVNGQSAAAAHVVELPARTASGGLELRPTLLPLSADTHDGPLPATRAAVLRQAFRFLGERYGWGHDYHARDCSGFVCEVYRSLGICLPRNTRDQAVSPAFARIPLGADWPRNRRLATLATGRPGDLVYIPGHVMMIVGHDADGPWVVHDTHDGRPAGEHRVAAANGVVVAPLHRVGAPAGRDAIDAATVLVRILSSTSAEPP